MQAREIQGEDYSPKPESMAPSVVSPWKKVLQFAAIASLLVLALPMALEGQIIPPIAIYMVLALAGLGLMQWKVRVGAIVLAVVGILFLLANLPFIIPALSVPASTVDFLTVSLTIICLIGVVVAAIGTFRRSPGLRSKAFVMALLVLALIAIGTGVAGRLSYDSASAQAGDIRLVTEDIQYSERSIQADAGEVSVFVENKDTALHTFTIEDLDIDIEIPGNTTGRVTFDAEAGTYEFFCRPHAPDMSGTIEIAG